MDLELPIDADSPHYSVGVTINNIGYVFNVRWNERLHVTSGGWVLDLLDENGDEENPIASGIPIVLGALLGRRSTDVRFPDGALFASDLSGKNQEATINDLGVRVKVFFRPAEDF